MTSTNIFVFFVVIPLLPTLTWQPGPHAADRRPVATTDNWRSRLGPGSRPMGWGRGRYGEDYDVNNEEEDATTSVSLRMPGVYVQQVCIIIVVVIAEC